MWKLFWRVGVAICEQICEQIWHPRNAVWIQTKIRFKTDHAKRIVVENLFFFNAWGGSAGADACAGGAKVEVEVKTKVEVRVNVAGGALVLEGEVHGAGEHR